MLMQPTIEKLHSMKLFGMADAIRRLEICDDRYATRSTILAVCNTSALTDYIRSKRSRFITLFQALTKSRTNFSFPSSAA